MRWENYYAAGIRMVWWPTACNPDRTTYWVMEGTDGSPWKVVPAKRRSVHVYYLNGDRVYRDVDHPDGPSSIPYLRLRSRSVRPDEGHPTGTSEEILYRVAYVRKRVTGVRIRRLRRDDT